MILLIIGGSASQKLAADIANILNEKLGNLEIKKFPDGEKYIRFNDDIEDEITIVQSTGYPQDENLIELFLIAKNLKSLGCKKVRAVIPYLAYSRQDKRFKKGEAISISIIANLIESSGIDEVITVNLHEEKIVEFFNIPVKNLSAMPLLAEYFKDIVNNPIVVAPDEGALQHAKEVAKILDCEYDYLKKKRISPDKVSTEIKEINVKNKDVILVDDIISTGGTIINASKILKNEKAKNIFVGCVHPVLVGDALMKIYLSGVKEIVGTDTLSSPISKVSVAPLLANTLK